MTARELKRFLAAIPGNADIVVEKKIREGHTLVFPVLSFRVAKARTGEPRIVLSNNKPVQNA